LKKELKKVNAKKIEPLSSKIEEVAGNTLSSNYSKDYKKFVSLRDSFSKQNKSEVQSPFELTP